MGTETATVALQYVPTNNVHGNRKWHLGFHIPEHEKSTNNAVKKAIVYCYIISFNNNHSIFSKDRTDYCDMDNIIF